MTEIIRSHTFDNGLVLVAEPMPWLESAAFTLLVPAGAVYDPPQREGLAAFTCEMVLRGAGPRNSRQFVDALDNLGVERGESVGDAHMAFSGATLSTSLHTALEIYADVLRRPHLPADQVEASRQVCLQELQAVEDEPHQKVMLEVRRRAYPDPWGRPSQGNRESIESITHDDVAANFARLFRPGGAILGVAGRFDFDELVKHVGRLLEDWEPAEVELPAEEPFEDTTPHLHHETEQTHIGIAYPSVPYRDPEYFRAWGAVGALSGGMSARLFTEVREKRGLCYTVYATYHTLRDRGAVFCYSGTSASRAQETLDVLLAELQRLEQGIEEHELKRMKARIKSSLIMQQESSTSRSSAVARDWYHLGRVRPLDELSAIIDALDCAGINGYLAKNPPRQFTIVTLGPEPLEVPVGVS